MASVNQTIRKLMLTHPGYFTSRTDVLYHVLCGIGNGFKWKNGAAVQEKNKRASFPLWSPEFEIQQFEDMISRFSEDEKTYFRLTEGPKIDKKIAELSAYVANIDVLATTRVTSPETFGIMSPKNGRNQSQYALLMHIPDDVKKDWREACDEMIEFATRNSGWKF
jgi:hypothetical protein